MRVEELFKFIDKLFRLDRVPNTVILLLSTTLMFLLSLLILYRIRQQTNGVKLGKSGKSFNALTRSVIYAHVCIALSTIIGMSHSIYRYSISPLLVLSFVTYIAYLVSTLIIHQVFPQEERKKLLLLFFITSLLYTFFFSSKVLLNGIEASETTVDTLQIFHDGYWRFSRHAGWYDLAPVDAIVKVFLLHVLAVESPYDPVTTTLMYSALSFSILIFMLTFIQQLPYGDTVLKWALLLLLLSIHPYTFLIEMSTPPTNFSLVLSMFAIVLVSRYVYGRGGMSIHAMLTAFIIFTTAPVLAHPMSIMIPAYLSAILLSMAGSSKGPSKSIYVLTIISIIMFFVKMLFTGASVGGKTFTDILVKGFTTLLTLLFTEEPVDVKMYVGGPEPPKSTLFSFSAFLGFIGALLFIELVKLLKRGEGDKATMMVLGIGLLLTFAGATTNIVEPSSRYLAIPGITLCSFQSIIYVTRILHDRTRLEWRAMFSVLIGVMCLAAILSPNAMIEEYNVFTGGRWPRIENFILSRYLLDHVDPEYVVKVFHGLDRAKLYLYFTPDILYYGHPYHHIEVLITEKFLIPRLINARSYWDFYGGRLFVRYAGYIDPIKISEGSTIFTGWKWVMVWE